MKELPKEFQFKCDEHSKEQCEKLGIENIDFKTFLFNEFTHILIRNMKLSGYTDYQEDNVPLINLADYIEEETTGTMKLANDGSVFYGTTNQNPKLEFRSGDTTYIHPDAVPLPHIVKPSSSTPDDSDLIVEMTKANVAAMLTNGAVRVIHDIVDCSIRCAEETIKQLKERGYLK